MHVSPNQPAPPPEPGTVPAAGWILLAAAVAEKVDDPEERREWAHWAISLVARPAGDDDGPPVNNQRRLGARPGYMAPMPAHALTDFRIIRRNVASARRRRKSSQ